MNVLPADRVPCIVYSFSLKIVFLKNDRSALHLLCIQIHGYWIESPSNWIRDLWNGIELILKICVNAQPYLKCILLFHTFIKTKTMQVFSCNRKHFSSHLMLMLKFDLSPCQVCPLWSRLCGTFRQEHHTRQTFHLECVGHSPETPQQWISHLKLINTQEVLQRLMTIAASESLGCWHVASLTLQAQFWTGFWGSVID